MDTYALEKLTGWTPELSRRRIRHCFRCVCWRGFEVRCRRFARNGG